MSGTSRSVDAVAEGEVRVERRIDVKKEVVYARARVDQLFLAWTHHAALWGLPNDGLAASSMRQALGGVALYMSNRPRDEAVGFTLNAPHPPMNVFFTGTNAQERVTGRYFDRDVKTAPDARLFVEYSRAGKSHTSVIDVQGLDVLGVLEQFTRRSDQSPARFFEVSEDDFLMAVSLPRDENDWLATMTRDEAMAAFDAARSLDEKRYWFQCGCDPERMLEVMRGLYAGRAHELFGDDSAVTISCPRCGRAWSVSRESF